jgi:hypothetical protein
MSLLAGGGALSSAKLILAAGAMVMRCLVRFILPGVVVYEVGIALLNARAAPRVVNHTPL